MFFEDFSNPKYVSDNCKWVFPKLENFYLNNSELFYESRKIQVEKPIEGTPSFLLVVPSSDIDLTYSGIHDYESKIKISLYGKAIIDNEEYEDNTTAYKIEPLLIKKGPFDYYRIYGNPSGLGGFQTSYKVEIRNYGTNSIKIYGL